MMMADLLSAVKWNNQGLVCAVVQDRVSLRVLMVAWLNEQALMQTLQTGLAHYYSRSRRQQWMKGEKSGHVQKVHEIRLDCDGDALLMLVEQQGGIACHTGHQSCFYRVCDGTRWQMAETVVKREMDIYGYEHSHDAGNEKGD